MMETVLFLFSKFLFSARPEREIISLLFRFHFERLFRFRRFETVRGKLSMHTCIYTKEYLIHSLVKLEF